MGDEIYNYWKNEDSRVTLFHLFDDPYQPYSCTQWGNQGTIDIPPIINDGTENIIGAWFTKFADNSRPYTVFIDHNMIVRYFIDGRCNTDLSGNDVEPDVCVEKRINTLLDELALDLEFASNPSIIKYFNISQLYPNPFNPVLNINFDIAWSGVIQVNILDISGSHIETLHSGFLQSGSHEFSWHAESMPSGMYLVSLKFGDESLTEKVVLLK